MSHSIARNAFKLSLAATLVAGASGLSQAKTTSDANLVTAQQKLATMSVPFVPNHGQWNKQAAFAAKMFAGTLFVTTEGRLVYSLPGSAPAEASAIRSTPSPAARERVGVRAFDQQNQVGISEFAAGSSERNLASAQSSPSPSALSRTAGEGTKPAAPTSRALTLTESFITPEGKLLPARPYGYRPAKSTVSYFIGSDEAKHRSNVNTYERVSLGDVFPGINVQLRATGSNVEKIFTVAPHQDPKQIHVKLDGANKLEIGSKGELIAHTNHGPVTYTAPIAFQEDASGAQAPVEVQYALVQRTGDHASASTTYAFTLGAYDESKPLTIDPLLQSTYLGGSSADSAYAVAVHPHTGDIYVTGSTSSTNFPALTGGADDSFNGPRDVYVSRFSGDLKRLIQSTVIGAAGDEYAQALAIHPGSGDVYVAGFTKSSSGFPGLSGASQPTYGGGNFDAFVSRLSADLKTLYRSSYLGGSSDDTANALAIHPVTGAVYVAGTTLSANFPGVLGGAQPTNGGSSNTIDGDAFVSAFSADLGTRLQSTYLGGAGSDSATAIAIHQQTGEVYVAGWTLSAAFPIGSGAHAQAALNGFQDAFVVRLDAGLTSVRGGTFLGGAAFDEATALAIDQRTGEVILAGSSTADAPGQPLPGLTNAAQPTNGGLRDVFVSRLSRDLSTVLQSTFLGGISNDDSHGVTIHATSGEIYVTGRTISPDFLGVTGGIQETASGQHDAFVVRLSADLRRRLQATYLGSSGSDEARGIAVHPASGDVIVVGNTDTNAPIFVSPSATVIDGTATPLTYGGGFDAFVARLSSDLTAVNRTPNPFSFIAQSNVPPNTLRTSNEVQLIITPTPPDNQQTAYVTGALGSEFCVTNTAGCCATPLPACSGFASGWITAPYQFLSGDRVAVRHYSASPAGTAETRLITSGAATPFRTSTGNAAFACNLDMNGDNLLQGNREGLALVRAMLGIKGDAVVAGTGVVNWEPYRHQLNTYCGTHFEYAPPSFQ